MRQQLSLEVMESKGGKQLRWG